MTPRKRGRRSTNFGSVSKRSKKTESFTVEKIVTHLSVSEAKEKSKAGTLKYDMPSQIDSKCETLYLVKWVGYPEAENSWEPEESFRDGDMIREYKSKNSVWAKQENGSDFSMPEESCKYVDDYNFGNKIGTGDYGDVFGAKHKVTGVSYAVKIARHEKHIAEIIRSVGFQKKIIHDNVVKCYEHYIFPEHSFLVYELCDHTLLQEIKQNGPLPEKSLIKLAKDCLSGLDHIHKFGVHRDVKPENIFKKGRTYKIADFGIFCDKKLLKSYCGTRGYIAPEMNGKRQYNSLVDLYSFGVVLAEAALGSYASGENLLSSKVGNLDPFLRSLVTGLVLERSNYRLSASEALQHPWLQSKFKAGDWLVRNIRLQEEAIIVDLRVCCLKSDTIGKVEKRIRLMHRIGSRRIIQLSLLEEENNNSSVDDSQIQMEVQPENDFHFLRDTGRLCSAKSKYVIRNLTSDVHVFMNMFATCEYAKKVLVTKDQFGLISMRILKPGEMVAEIHGRVHLYDEFKNQNFDSRVFVYDGVSDCFDREANQITVCVDTRSFKHDSSALRRSCKPNCVLKHVILDGEFALILVAKSDVQISTELTISADALWTLRSIPLKCAIHGDEFDKCPDDVAEKVKHKDNDIDDRKKTWDEMAEEGRNRKSAVTEERRTDEAMKENDEKKEKKDEEKVKENDDKKNEAQAQKIADQTEASESNSAITAAIDNLHGANLTNHVNSPDVEN